MAQEIQNLQQLFELIAKHFGLETGKKIRKEIDEVLSLQGVDTKDLQDRIKVIQSILDADPSTPQFDVAKNIITQIKNIVTKADKLQSQLDDLQNKVKELQKGGQQQTEESSQANIKIQKQIDDLQAKLKSLIDAKADKEYVDAKFISYEELFSIRCDKIAKVFSTCLDKGYEDKKAKVNDCNNNKSTSGSASATPTSNMSDASNSSDGGVL